jgi:hypothetical protein
MARAKQVQVTRVKTGRGYYPRRAGRFSSLHTTTEPALQWIGHLQCETASCNALRRFATSRPALPYWHQIQSDDKPRSSLMQPVVFYVDIIARSRYVS